MTDLAKADDDRSSVLEQDERFFRALVTADLACLGKLLSDDFILVGVADGATVTKSQLIEIIGAGFVRFLTIESFPDQATVRRAGSDAVIVVGRTAMTLSIAAGAAVPVDSRYTHVFTETVDGWRLIAAQGTEIRSGASAASSPGN
jgi:ketosteroid isomerase-like protein